MQTLDCLSWFEGFEPSTLPPGLTAPEFTHLCANLYDLARKIGEIQIPHSRFVVQTPSSPIHLAASLEPTDLVLEVWQGHYGKRTLMQPIAAKQAFVLWEVGLPASDVRHFLLAADLELHACGKCVGGVRERTNALRVEDRFPKGQHTATILTTQIALHSATFVALYDRPDQLVVISDPFGNDMICRADERTYMERHVLVQKELFQELGIPDLDTLLSLSEQARALVRQHVGQRLARLLQELN